MSRLRIVHTSHEPLRTAARVRKIFLQDVMSLKSAISEYGNPFLEISSDLIVLDTRGIAEKSVIENVYRIEALDCQQYDNGVHERLGESTKHM